jgi:hypothetical protein
MLPYCKIGSIIGKKNRRLNLSLLKAITFYSLPSDCTSLALIFQAHQNLSGNSASLVRNELMHTDIKTGKSVSLRATGLEEPPIQVSMIQNLFLCLYVFSFW